MTVQLFKNNARTTLDGGIDGSVTSITVSDASVFGVVASPNYMMLTLVSGSPEDTWEIVKCTDITGNVLTVNRGQDGTAAVAWGSGSAINGRLNAGSIYAFGGSPVFTGLSVTTLTINSISVSVSNYGRTLIDDADAETARATLELGNLAVLNTVTTGQVDGLDTALGLRLNTASVSAYGLTLIDDATAAAACTTLGLGTGNSPTFTGLNVSTLTINSVSVSVSDYGRTLIDDATAAAACTTLGLGTGNSPTFTGLNLTTLTVTTIVPRPVLSATSPIAQTYTPSAAGTATLDLSLSNQHEITMPAGDITIALSNPANSQCFLITITQDGTGSRTVTWFTTIRWAGGSAPTLTTTASKRDVLGFRRTGSGTYDGFVIGQSI